jgi:hypothetical protein
MNKGDAMRIIGKYGVMFLPVIIFLVSGFLYAWAEYTYICGKDNWVSGGLLIFAYWTVITVLLLPVILLSVYQSRVFVRCRSVRFILVGVYVSLGIAAYFVPRLVIPVVQGLKQPKGEVMHPFEYR